jgi:putative methyltransferase
MSDSNFGIRNRDVSIAEYLAQTRQTYGYPEFISVSWVKNSSDKVLRISEILQSARVGFRVTLALQSLNEDTLRAVNRINFKREFYERIRKAYHDAFLYSYIELMLGLPLETYESYMAGLEELMSRSVFDQIYSYPFLLFPNTQVASSESRRKYGIVGRVMEGRYTKSKVSTAIVENMEVVIGTEAMPPVKWIDAFVDGYYTIGLHDDRLAFFVFWYLKNKHSVRITDLVVWMRKESARMPQMYPLIHRVFEKLADCARNVQDKGYSQLLEPEGYGGIPYDPPDGVFLELLMHKADFYTEFQAAVRTFLGESGVRYNEAELADLFVFQNVVLAHPNNREQETNVRFQYDWVGYFSEAFNLEPAGDLVERPMEYRVRDDAPCAGDAKRFLETHFRIRGVPPFNELYDGNGRKVFPPVNIRMTE